MSQRDDLHCMCELAVETLETSMCACNVPYAVQASLGEQFKFELLYRLFGSVDEQEEMSEERF